MIMYRIFGERSAAIMALSNVLLLLVNVLQYHTFGERSTCVSPCRATKSSVNGHFIHASMNSGSAVQRLGSMMCMKYPIH